MKKLSSFLVALALFGAILWDVKTSQAEGGWENAPRVAVGDKVESRAVSVTTHTATTILSANVFRPDATCFNNSAYTIYIGSAASGTVLSSIGLPILSSATFRIGSMTGVVSALADAAAAGDTNVRCFDGLTP